ncbi:MAG: GAF domain-containing protein [Chloroflexi bacterium]|nr:GAF domain-containing protein [Chloroflexota bacterium]
MQPSTKRDEFQAPSFSQSSRQRFLEIVYTVVETIRTVEPLELLLKAVLDQLLHDLSATLGFIALYVPESQQITFPYAAHINAAHINKAITLDPISSAHEKSLAGWVIANGLPYVTGDWQHDSKPVAGVIGPEPAASIICVPIESTDDILGALSIQSEQEAAFTHDDFNIITAVAAHLASAINQSKKINQARELVNKGTRDYQLAVALRQAISIISSTLERKTISNHLLLALDGVLTYDTAFIFLQDTAAHLQLVASRDALNRPLDQSPDELEAIWNNSELLDAIRQSKEPLLIADTQQEPRWPTHPGSQKVRSWLGAPPHYRRRSIRRTPDTKQPNRRLQQTTAVVGFYPGCPYGRCLTKRRPIRKNPTTAKRIEHPLPGQRHHDRQFRPGFCPANRRGRDGTRSPDR